MKLILLFSILLSIPVFSDSSGSLRTEALKLLPEEISSLDKTKELTTLQKTFAKKIKTQKENALFVNYFQKSNDLTIGLKEKRFQYAYFKVPSNYKEDTSLLFQKAYQRLSPEEQKTLINPTELDHEAGRYLTIDLPKDSISLRFRNNQNKDLDSILFWNLGENKP